MTEFCVDAETLDRVARYLRPSAFRDGALPSLRI